MSNTRPDVVILALESAHEALCRSHGLVVTDRPDLVADNIKWTLDEKKTIERLEAALLEYRVHHLSPHAAHSSLAVQRAALVTAINAERLCGRTAHRGGGVSWLSTGLIHGMLDAALALQVITPIEHTEGLLWLSTCQKLPAFTLFDVPTPETHQTHETHETHQTPKTLPTPPTLPTPETPGGASILTEDPRP